MYKILVDGEWTEGMPTINCQRYRYYRDAVNYHESFWYVPMQEVD